MSAIPVTILTGFLGAGKTTLLKHWLTHEQPQHVVIIENEFGDVNIDSQLLPRSQINLIELTQGCLCCSLRGELTQALRDLLVQLEAQSIPCESIILETTGLADPAPIIQLFFTEEDLRERLQLDAVVTLVDALHIDQQLREHRVVASQIGFADRLIVTKSAALSQNAQTALVQQLQRINPRADLYFAEQGKIASEAWHRICAFHLNDAPLFGRFFAENTQQTQRADQQKTQIMSTLSLSHNQAENPPCVTSIVLRAGRLDIKKIGDFMSSLIEQYGHDMLRYKGLIALIDEPRKLIVQGVHKVVGFDYDTTWQPTETPETTIVIISRPLPTQEILSAFHAIC